MERKMHTPGEWSVHPTIAHDVRDRDGNILACAFLYDSESIPREATLANAQLIAAAPELLEALREAVRVHGDQYSWGPSARAAIAKAMGE